MTDMRTEQATADRKRRSFAWLTRSAPRNCNRTRRRTGCPCDRAVAFCDTDRESARHRRWRFLGKRRLGVAEISCVSKGGKPTFSVLERQRAPAGGELTFASVSTTKLH